jgi:hypothetical protein
MMTTAAISGLLEKLPVAPPRYPLHVGTAKTAFAREVNLAQS